MQLSDVPEVRTWLLHTPHVDDGGVSLMAGLVAQVRGKGLPVWRCAFGLMTKHPELVWTSVHWNEDKGMSTIDRPRATLDSAYFTRSPIALLRQGSPPIRVRLHGHESTFPICEDLRQLGG